MDSRHKQIITSNFVLLTRELPTTKILGYFLFDGLFSDRMVQEILETPPSRRNYQLISLLTRRGPRAYNCLLEALKACDRSDLIQALTLDSEIAKLTV